MYSSYSVAAAVCSVVFPVLASLAVGIRLRARKIKSLSYKTDDYVIVVALCLSISLCCIVLYGSFKASYGQHLSTITPPEYTVYQRHLYFTVIVAHLAIGSVKISVLTFYKRIFITPTFHRSANIVLLLDVAWILGTLITQIFSAWPISNWWTLGSHYDLNYGAFLTAFAAVDIALDIATLCLPLPVIKSLHMSRKRKFILAGIFWLGIFCVVSAAVRLYFAYELSLAGNATHVSDDHFSYVSVNSVIWSEIEPCASIIAACLPTFGPMVKGGHSIPSLARSIKSHIFKRMGSTSTSSQQLGVASLNGQSREAPRAKRAWFKLQDRDNSTSCTGDIEQGHSDFLSPKPGEIKVQSTFASKMESR